MSLRSLSQRDHREMSLNEYSNTICCKRIHEITLPKISKQDEVNKHLNHTAVNMEEVKGRDSLVAGAGAWPATRNCTRVGPSFSRAPHSDFARNRCQAKAAEHDAMQWHQRLKQESAEDMILHPFDKQLQ